jgi:hypothetical protein
MMILVHLSPKTLEPYRTPKLGVLCSPRCVYGEDIQAWPWAADNDAFLAWNPDKYRAMLERIWGRRGCLFVTAPDVVGDSPRTLERFEEWYDDLVSVLQPIALVGQDGMTPEDVPWQRIDALFVGGSSIWKCGEEARALVGEAKRRGKWVHMGRVNTDQRMRLAESWMVDSIDGTSVSRFRDTHLPKRLRQAARPAQLGLHEEEAA